MLKSKLDVWQGVVAFVGITLGVIPLVQKMLTGSTGSLWRFVPGGGKGSPALIAAGVVALGALLVVVCLERQKRR